MPKKEFLIEFPILYQEFFGYHPFYNPITKVTQNNDESSFVLSSSDIEKDSLGKKLIEKCNFWFYLEKNKQLLGGNFEADKEGFIFAVIKSPDVKAFLLNVSPERRRDSILLHMIRTFEFVNSDVSMNEVKGAKELHSWFVSCETTGVDSGINMSVDRFNLTWGNRYVAELRMTKFIKVIDRDVTRFYTQIDTSLYIYH